MMKRSISMLLVLTLLSSTSFIIFTPHAYSENPQDWTVNDWGGKYEELNGMIRFWGQDGEGVALYKEIFPQTDFEVSMQMKASTLGEASLNPAGEGIVLFIRSQLPIVSTYGVNFELRARGGGQFLLTRHNDNCDFYGWSWDWEPFVYNSLGYNNGYSYWNSDPSLDRANSTVKPNVWYTMKLKVQQNPFMITAEVLDENGTLLGSFPATDMNNFKFQDIKYIGIGTGYGGEFYVKNFMISSSGSDFTYSPSNPLTNDLTIFNATDSYPQDQATTYLWNFGDENLTSTDKPVISHVYLNPGQYNVTLTITGSTGFNFSTSKTIQVYTQTYLTISTESTGIAGLPVTINGKITDTNQNGLANEVIILFYTFEGLGSWYPISSTETNPQGNYEIQWFNNASGKFTLKAQWNGNQTHLSASATTTFSSLPYQNQYAFFVESNSRVTSLLFDSTNSELSFTVSGTSGTEGYVKITIAKTLLENIENLTVNKDGNPLDFTITELPDSWILTCNYSHSTHTLNIYLPFEEQITNDPAQIAKPSTDVPSTNDNSNINYNIWILVGIIIVAICSASILTLNRKKHTHQQNL